MVVQTLSTSYQNLDHKKYFRHNLFVLLISLLNFRGSSVLHNVTHVHGSTHDLTDYIFVNLIQLQQIFLTKLTFLNLQIKKYACNIFILSNLNRKKIGKYV